MALSVPCGCGRGRLCEPKTGALGGSAGLPVVFVQGQVRNSAVPWEEGMKLSQAIVAADYTGFMNPRLIRVLRNGQVAGEFKGIDLLHHEDMDLENGDTVLILQ
jgi:hypothetical protein